MDPEYPSFTNFLIMFMADRASLLSEENASYTTRWLVFCQWANLSCSRSPRKVVCSF